MMTITLFNYVILVLNFSSLDAYDVLSCASIRVAVLNTCM